MISRLNMGLGNGVFEDILGRECHFCIRPYKAKLDKTVLSSAEFSQFRQQFEDLGWKFQCGLMNLAVFYSGDGERPAEPPEDRQETQKRLLQITAGAELGYVLMDLFWSAFTVLMLSSVGANTVRAIISHTWQHRAPPRKQAGISTMGALVWNRARMR